MKRNSLIVISAVFIVCLVFAIMGCVRPSESLPDNTQSGNSQQEILPSTPDVKPDSTPELGTTLPRNDEQITTGAGDLILYLGSRFVIYYDTNSWNFTRLGKINNITQTELMNILGSGDVVVELSLAL